jgi:DNA invertase Pin-like site-specific DNA recombinase
MIEQDSSAGRFSFQVMASLAQMERELILELTNAGLAAAKGSGEREDVNLARQAAASST